VPDDQEKDDQEKDERDERDEESSSGEERDDAAQRVARALGVDGEAEEDAGSEVDEAASPANRAARRRGEALERRKKRKGSASSTAAKRVAVDDEDAPRDRNARARELLKKRREQAGDRQRTVSSALLPGEMVDDAFARIVSATGKWFRKNWSALQWAIVGIVLAGGAFMFFQWRSEKKSDGASGALAAALAAERGRVMPEDKRTDEEKEYDVTRVFKTADERTDAVLANYNKVIDEYPGTGAAMLAKLGQAGALLDKSDYAHALEAYQAVLSSPLAAADADVKGRALEGAGFAKEGKADLDGALATFKQLEGVDVKGFKELGQYHQARVLLAKGDKDKAKELLKAAREKLQQPGPEGKAFPLLAAVVDELLRKLDPTAVPPAPSRQLGGARPPMTQEQLEKLLRETRQDLEKKKGLAEPH
jgi:tetratricopeptide (TPR) repeat protein